MPIFGQGSVPVGQSIGQRLLEVANEYERNGLHDLAAEMRRVANMETPNKDEIAKLPPHNERPNYPFAARPAMPSSRKCPDDAHMCFNHYCRMIGGECIKQRVHRDERFVDYDLIQVATGVIALAVLAMFVGWWLLL